MSGHPTPAPEQDGPVDGGAPPEPPSAKAHPRERVEARGRDRDRTLAAVHELEAALAAAAPGRREAWRSDVATALESLDGATADEEANVGRPDSLLSHIARNQPRFRHRVHGLRAQYRYVRDTITTLRQELAAAESDVDVADIRQRTAWLLTALRHQRARESDLIYEALVGDIAGDAPTGR